MAPVWGLFKNLILTVYFHKNHGIIHTMIRTEESKLTNWHFEIDRRLLWTVLILVAVGFMYVISAGSAAADRIHMPWYFFLKKSIPFYMIGLTTLFGVSMLNKKWIMGISALNVAVGLLLLLVTFAMPHVIKGSARFVSLGPFNIMPSDIMKPGFVVMTAWFLTQMKSLYGENIFTNKQAWQFKKISWWTYLGVFVPALLVIFRHPDVGTAVLYSSVFCAMTFMAGLPYWLVAIAGGIVVMGGITAFFTMSHVHNRVISFLTGTGDTFQVRQSVESIQHGGLLGSGDDAFVKDNLPDAHTDFIFATIAEDLGAIIACVLLCGLVYILKRLTTDALESRDPFVFYVAGGATAMFGVQTCINLASTLHLIPPKGMTLPFISYGGSSFVAYCLLFGMVLALVRSDKWD